MKIYMGSNRKTVLKQNTTKKQQRYRKKESTICKVALWLSICGATAAIVLVCVRRFGRIKEKQSRWCHYRTINAINEHLKYVSFEFHYATWFIEFCRCMSFILVRIVVCVCVWIACHSECSWAAFNSTSYWVCACVNATHRIFFLSFPFHII